MSYYIGLSALSTNRGKVKREQSRAEARRILSLFEGKPVGENDIAREEQGRPFFQDRGQVDFNIAHSGALAAVSYVRGENPRTGCDVEKIRPRARAREIAEVFFSVPERKYLFNNGKFDEAGFYGIWTLKECFLKLKGFSVFDMALCPSFIDGEGRFFTSGSALSFYLYELSNSEGERYMLAAAVEGTEQSRPEIRWFSQSLFDCKSIAEIKAAPSPAETVRPKM